jgi:vacuolar-type H+-ATPase subunit I/STV1
MRTAADNRPFARVQCTDGLGKAMGEMMADKTKADIASVQASILTPGANVGNVANGAAGTDVVGVDKIRDLLFGNQMQDYDRRFSKLEERFLARFKEIESETARNLSAHDTNAKKQVDSLASQLREEKDTRADADKEIERSLREQNQVLEKRLRTLSDQVSQLERDFADRLSRETQSLHEEIKRRNEDIHHTMEKMFSELSNVKTDRNLLAGLFVEVAKCLNQDSGSGKSPGKGEGARGWPNG